MLLRYTPVRAAIAIGLLAGFYLLGLGVGLGLIWLGWEALGTWVVAVPSADCNSLFGCTGHVVGALWIAAGVVVLWSLRPRRDLFEPPGVQVNDADQPELFAELRGVAETLKQPMPHVVCVTDDTNAFVTHRGGVMGVGTRTFLGVGLPLFQALGEQELRALFAHELAHGAPGETRVATLLGHTQQALARTLEATEEKITSLPFILYSRACLYVVMALSRRSEFDADERAATVAGPEATAALLRQIQFLDLQFELYMATVVDPVVRAGHVPPLLEGFQAFAERSKIQELIEAASKDASPIPDDWKTQLLDSHPPVAARLARLGPGATTPIDRTPPARRWLRDVAGLERAVLGVRYADVDGLPDLVWADTGRVVLLPAWRKEVARHHAALRELSVAGLPASPAEAVRLGRLLTDPFAKLADDEDLAERMIGAIGAAVCVRLADLDWECQVEPGAPVAFRRGRLVFEPFEEVRDVVTEKRAALDWARKCEEAGLCGALAL